MVCIVLVDVFGEAYVGHQLRHELVYFGDEAFGYDVFVREKLNDLEDLYLEPGTRSHVVVVVVGVFFDVFQDEEQLGQTLCISARPGQLDSDLEQGAHR